MDKKQKTKKVKMQSIYLQHVCVYTVPHVPEGTKRCIKITK